MRQCRSTCGPRLSAGRSRIIDGYELSYGFKHLQRFREAKELFERQIPEFSGSPQKLKEHGRLGFGLWRDYDWRNKRFRREDNTRFAVNVVVYVMT